MNQNANMTEKELLTDLLNTEKQLIKDYASNTTESACPNLRRVLLGNMTECSQDQYQIFEQMRQRNLYKVKDAQDQDVTTAKQNMQTLKQQSGM